tara:strand:+ start:3651 stop:3824 length:174 start_codon:yes stop_codon:yes gene_type:complete
MFTELLLSDPSNSFTVFGLSLSQRFYNGVKLVNLAFGLCGGQLPSKFCNLYRIDPLS